MSLVSGFTLVTLVSINVGFTNTNAIVIAIKSIGTVYMALTWLTGWKVEKVVFAMVTSHSFNVCFATTLSIGVAATNPNGTFDVTFTS